MNSVPKLFSCCYADCWTENHFSTRFSVLTLNHTHSHPLFRGCISRWFGRALAWYASGHRDQNRPGNLHQKEKALHRNVWCFFVLPAVYLNDPFREKCVCRTPRSATNANINNLSSDHGQSRAETISNRFAPKEIHPCGQGHLMLCLNNIRILAH